MGFVPQTDRLVRRHRATSKPRRVDHQRPASPAVDDRNHSRPSSQQQTAHYISRCSWVLSVGDIGKAHRFFSPLKAPNLVRLECRLDSTMKGDRALLGRPILRQQQATIATPGTLSSLRDLSGLPKFDLTMNSQP